MAEPSDPDMALAYAHALFMGAVPIAAAKQENRRFIHSFFLLICFALENALKAYLQFAGMDKVERLSRRPACP